ncbi:hypothetical protein [Clostridium botulinum]|uniref:hypothetical protein n=1 Tax=Clostridium botulinum TaxID=1491 RepID=UPI0002D71159|nr:hypothetical protein [Clostridium botulinum]KEI02169.1 hypothetical protein Z953_07925 [Clostridium botulinum D str. 16868]KLU76431.1 hypothetical protein CBC3_03800 [Clostridium botulinum V891]KOA78838.1 hypothetical protein ADU78_00775 [Clostridium botulinum]KOA90797.1 hypothetical protein ADU76_12795 [Clostridium botulinum]KOC31123.1 hypothetical protein ADU81_14240 [Clostridium botulinum]
MKKTKLGSLVLAATLLIGGISANIAYAREIQINKFNVDVPRLGGHTYSNTNIIKAHSNEEAICNCTHVGGGKELYVRIETSDGRKPSNFQTISSGYRVEIPNAIGAGETTRLRFDTPGSTIVYVNAYGSWSPDNKLR